MEGAPVSRDAAVWHGTSIVASAINSQLRSTERPPLFTNDGRDTAGLSAAAETVNNDVSTVQNRRQLSITTISNRCSRRLSCRCYSSNLLSIVSNASYSVIGLEGLSSAGPETHVAM